MVDPSAEAPLVIRKLVQGKTFVMEKTRPAISANENLFVIINGGLFERKNNILTFFIS
jgi:hypothetical protein